MPAGPSNKDDIPTASEKNSSDWTKKVVERLVEAEKKWFDLASEQNALALKAIKESFDLYRSAPNPALADWAKQGIESFLEAQRKWAESAMQQRNQFLRQEEGKVEGTGGQRRTPNDYAQQQVRFMVEARKKWLDFANQQNAQFLEAVRQGLGGKEGSPAKTMADMAQESMENYVQIQKRWLDLMGTFTLPGSNRGGSGG